MTGHDRPGVRRLVLAAASTLLAALPTAGCRPAAVTFPAKPVAASDTRADYDTDGDGQADFFMLADEKGGRFTRIGYDRDGDGRLDRVVNLDAIDPALCRHLVLVLDGIPFDVVREYRAGGGLRAFDPPVQLVPPYPVMTDLALEDAFGYMPCAGLQAKYYSRTKRRVVGGTRDYLAGRNEPFARIISYRTHPINDGLAYLWPRAIFEKEINDAKRLWDRRRQMETVIYIVSAAALGSRRGEQGQLHALRRCEQFIHQALYETSGLVKVTFFADHGQTNVPCEQVDLGGYLKKKGWRMTKKVRGGKDAALIRYGLVTYAAFNTRRPAALADDLLAHEAVTLASYAEGDAVVVRTRGGRATIRSADGKTFEYNSVKGDPLKLADLVKGAIDGRALLKATVAAKHPYPDALYRLWRAHFAVVENPPDVIVDLDDRFCNGSRSFSGSVEMLSTHGGLNRASSTTFFMTTAGRVAGPLRSEDVPGLMQQIYRRPFPYGR